MSVGWSLMPRPKSDISLHTAWSAPCTGIKLCEHKLSPSPHQEVLQSPINSHRDRPGKRLTVLLKGESAFSPMWPPWTQGKPPPLPPLSLGSAFCNWLSPPTSWDSALNSWSPESARREGLVLHTWGFQTRLQKEPSGADSGEPPEFNKMQGFSTEHSWQWGGTISHCLGLFWSCQHTLQL